MKLIIYAFIVPCNLQLQSSSQYVKTRAEEVLKNRDATEKSSSLIALFAKYIEGIRSTGKASYSEPEDGWVIVYNLFFAATDTIHEVLLWLTLFLATRPDIQEKVMYLPICYSLRVDHFA